MFISTDIDLNQSQALLHKLSSGIKRTQQSKRKLEMQ